MSSLIVEVCEIKNIEKHPNADRLEIATVKGWNVITQLGQYKVGDLVVFIPPDCILPTDLIEKYELSYLKNGGRTGTVKLRGVISQGLVLPIDCLRDSKLGGRIPHGEGDNVSSPLGITKYEVPEPSYNPRSGNMVSKKKMNPLFDKYTDIENIKNYDTVFAEGELVVITEKLHGTNARFGNLEIQINSNAPILYKFLAWFNKNILGKKYEFVYGSHNVQKSGVVKSNHYYGEDVWGAIAQRYDMANLLPKDYIFYGEVVGANIQDLNYGFTKYNELFIFDIKNVVTGEYLDWDLVVEWCNTLGLQHVPELAVGAFNVELLPIWTGGHKSVVDGKTLREGVVIKPLEESNDRMIGRKILKSINPDYLLRKNGTEYT